MQKYPLAMSLSTSTPTPEEVYQLTEVSPLLLAGRVHRIAKVKIVRDGCETMRQSYFIRGKGGVIIEAVDYSQMEPPDLNEVVILPIPYPGGTLRIAGRRAESLAR
jgi:hypothetical protein